MDNVKMLVHSLQLYPLTLKNDVRVRLGDVCLDRVSDTWLTGDDVITGYTSPPDSHAVTFTCNKACTSSYKVPVFVARF